MSEYEGYSIEYHHKFKKEFNKIINRHQCPSLKQDFKLLIETLTLNLTENQRFPEHVCMRIAGLDDSVKFPAFIIKSFVVKISIRVLILGLESHFYLILKKADLSLLKSIKRILKKLKIKIESIIYLKNLLKFVMNYTMVKTNF